MFGASELDTLNSVEHLSLQQLSEPGENLLLITLDEAAPNPSASVQGHPKGPGLGEILKGAAPIQTTKTCKRFELFWKRYIAYSVTEEFLGCCGVHDDEAYTGKLFRVYSKSHFLTHLSRDTGAHTEPIQDFKVVCMNHLVDVASYAPPDIRVIEPASRKQPRVQ
jgi:hypothetical protein